MIHDKNSMIYWYNKIKGLKIPMPKTEIVVLDNKNERLLQVVEGHFAPIYKQWAEIIAAGLSVGYPLFMRTDEFSGKHNWKNTCYVAEEKDLKPHIMNLFEDSFTANLMGLPIRALVFREYIQMKNLFTAFHGSMPVNPELRFFVRNGKVTCWHEYWISDAIEKGTDRKKLPRDWKDLLKKAQDAITPAEIKHLTEQSELIAKTIKGAWSIDWCLSDSKKWYMIDMALYDLSWHPKCGTVHTRPFTKKKKRPFVGETTA